MYSFFPFCGLTSPYLFCVFLKDVPGIGRDKPSRRWLLLFWRDSSPFGKDMIVFVGIVSDICFIVFGGLCWEGGMCVVAPLKYPVALSGFVLTQKVVNGN